jgi:hypothetical protein
LNKEDRRDWLHPLTPARGDEAEPPAGMLEAGLL